MVDPCPVPPDPRPDDRPWPELRWPPPPGTVLTGTVVILAAYAEPDAGPLFAALDDDQVWQHLPYRPGSAAELDRWLSARRAEGKPAWTVRAAAGPVLGMASYLNASVRDARLEIGATAYTPQVWGTAVNPETKLLLLEYAFGTAGAGRVQFVTDIRNQRSQRALAGIGAVREGVLRRHMRRADGSVRDSVLFSVTAEDWPAVRTLLLARLTGPA